MSFSINPLNFQSMKLETKKERDKFLYQLSTLLSQITAQITATQSLAPVIKQYNPPAVSQTLDCTTASFLFVDVVINTATTATITLSSIAAGIPVVMRIANTSAGTATIKFNATNPTGGTVTVFYFSGGAPVNLGTTGVVIGTGIQRCFAGGTDSVDLFMTLT